MKLLDGKKLSKKILEKLKKEIEKKQLKLKLAVILVNRERVSESFVRQIENGCKRIEVGFELVELSFKKKELSSKKEIERVIKDPNNSGVVIVGRKDFSNLILPEKDVEKPSPVVCAVERILKEYKIFLAGKIVVLVGRGRLVGRPLAEWLRKKKIQFFLVDKFTKNIPSFIKKADILISGAGKPNLISGKIVKRGAVVIDVGGDVDFKSVSKKASYLTPTPGGVGPVVVACLLKNLIKLKK